jgi:hypothetical protein
MAFGDGAEQLAVQAAPLSGPEFADNLLVVPHRTASLVDVRGGPDHQLGFAAGDIPRRLHGVIQRRVPWFWFEFQEAKMTVAPATVRVDKRGVVQAWSAEAEKLFGFTAAIWLENRLNR